MDDRYHWPRTVTWKGVDYTINHFYDQPYLAGSSRDGRTIYFQRGWNPHAEIDGKMVDRLLPVVAHEVEEKKAEDRGLPYLEAHHHYAEPAERQVVTAMGIKWKDYQASFRGDILKCEKEKHPSMPADEEMKPYLHTRFMRTRRRN